MHPYQPVLQDLALVFCVAAVTTVVFRRLHQPVVLGYLLAGMMVGPHIPFPLFADLERVHTLAELGVILVMYSVGLEFSIRRLIGVLPKAGMAGLIQISLMIWLGYLTAQAFGWTAQESLFCGAMVAISSTMIVARVFEERKVRGALADLVFGVLVVQDLAAVLLLALLTAISSGTDSGGQVLAASALRLAGFLLALAAGGFLVVPRAIRFIAKLESPETLLVACIGLCFAFALLAQKLGYSVALGAFLAGSLVAESGEARKVEHLVRPVRDLFAAVFFVSVGMIVDPAVLADSWPAVLVLTALVLLGQTASVSLGAFLSGAGTRTSIQAGMSLAQIGEFSFIIVSAGVALGVVGGFLFPIAVSVAVLTTFATPWMVRAADPVSLAIDRRLPRRVQTFAALYGSWLERARSARDRAGAPRPLRLIALIVVDAALIACTVIGASLWMVPLSAAIGRWSGLGASAARIALIAAASALSSLFLLGIARCAGALASSLAAAALPVDPAAAEDASATPRRVLTGTILLAIVLLAGIPLLALTQPFLSPLYGATLMAAIVVFLGVAIWRGTATLHEQVQAGAQTIIRTLSRQALETSPPTLDEIQPHLPELGELSPVPLRTPSPAIGKTLAELNLRGLTGATVVAISRKSGGIIPSAHERLREGDVLALAGTHEAVEAAKGLLLDRPCP